MTAVVLFMTFVVAVIRWARKSIPAFRTKIAAIVAAVQVIMTMPRPTVPSVLHVCLQTGRPLQTPHRLSAIGALRHCFRQRSREGRDGDRFRHVTVEPGRQRAGLIGTRRVRSDRDDRQRP